MIYGKRSNGNKHGLVLTKPFIVEKMLEFVNYQEHFNLSKIKLIEPAAGEGVFALSVIDTLYKSSIKHKFSFSNSLKNLKFIDIDDQIIDRLHYNLEYKLGELGYKLPTGLIEKNDFLTSQFDKADIIIGNPPYVRHENIPPVKKTLYRRIYGTFTHRSDLYIAFFEKALKCLHPDGQLSFICSNRWLKNQYGAKLRNLIHHNYNLLEVIDLEESSPFEESVIAYPAIFNVKNSNAKKNAKYFKLNDISSLKYFNKNKPPDKFLNTSSSNWFYSIDFKNSHVKFLDTIENQGFKIGIGVATGCDRVFIRKDFKRIVENELLLPILISKDVKNNTLKWSGNYLINPFDKNGNLIDIEKFPRTLKYFYSYAEILKKRHVAKKNKDKWFKTIDKVNYHLRFEAKIVLPDISGNTYIFIDEGNYYPHHNLYYIKGGSLDELRILAAILMSDFSKNQLMEFGNKMNGGFPRWQSQNLRKLRLPVIKAIPDLTKVELINAYLSKDLDSINSLITEDNISKYEIRSGQTMLFEPNENEKY